MTSREASEIVPSIDRAAGLEHVEINSNGPRPHVMGVVENHIADRPSIDVLT